MGTKTRTDSLAARMKRYEESTRLSLTPRTPVIIRVDGKAFHTYAAKCEKPFDRALTFVMDQVALRLCDEIQGAELGYVQSDEVSILVHSYKRFTSSSWFDNQVQKMVSVAAGIASATFTKHSWRIWADRTSSAPPEVSDIKPAVFDARAFVLPEDEVCNYFVWRQQDATRNSVQMVARSLYSHKQCDGKNRSELQEMIFQKGQNWDDVETRWKRGRCVVRSKDGVTNDFIFDNEVPIFTSPEGKAYIDDHLVKLEG